MSNEGDDPRNEARWQALSMRRSELELKEIFTVLGEVGIDAIVFKGWVAARNYPVGHFRYFNDIDIAVRREDYEQALNTIGSSELSRFNIDLHSEFRHLDRTPWDELFERTIITEVEGAKIRALSPEDHLRVLSAHWLNDGAEYKERLWDIYYAVASRPVDFDWDICLNSVAANRRGWVITAILIAQKYLDLDLTGIPISDEEQLIPKWVVRTIEREWSSDVRLLPLSSSFDDRKKFWQQLMKRIPPNPIQATIEADGTFDEKRRLHLQILTATRRLGSYTRKRWFYKTPS